MIYKTVGAGTSFSVKYKESLVLFGVRSPKWLISLYDTWGASATIGDLISGASGGTVTLSYSNSNSDKTVTIKNNGSSAISLTAIIN